MNLITGATGFVGGRAATLLKAAGVPIKLMVRDPKRLPPQLKDQPAVTAGYEDPAALKEAFKGIRTAFIVSGHIEPMKRAELHKNAFAAARDAGTGHIVYLSFQNNSPDSKFPYSRDHYQTEEYLKATGVPYTVLRDNLYTDFIPHLINESGVMRGPAGDGKVAWVSRYDVARCIADAVKKEPENKVYDLTGPEALTMEETVVRYGKIAGKVFLYEDEDPVAGLKWRAKVAKADWEPEVWMGSYLATKAGELEQVSDGVETLTGKRPLTIEEHFASQ